jgi:26S proteasome regulatory subunit N5
MLNLPIDELEQATSDFVTSKFLYARIDRPAGILTFGAKKTAEESLNGYQADVNKLLNLIEDSCHLIQKENMVHAARKESEKARAKAAAKRYPLDSLRLEHCIPSCVTNRTFRTRISS